MATAGSLRSRTKPPNDNKGDATDLRRRIIFPVRLTADEKRRLDSLARERGLRLAAYIRVTTLGGPMPPRRSDPVLVPAVNRDVYRHLGQVGNNLNQIARRLNIEDGSDPAATETLAAIREVLPLLLAVQGQLLGKGLS
jgi:mobilization protein NikA